MTTKDAIFEALKTKNTANDTYWYCRADLEQTTSKNKNSINKVLANLGEGDILVGTSRVELQMFKNPTTGINTKYYKLVAMPSTGVAAIDTSLLAQITTRSNLALSKVKAGYSELTEEELERILATYIELNKHLSQIILKS